MSRLVKYRDCIELVINGYATELELEIEGTVYPSEPQTHSDPGHPPYVDELTVWAMQHYDKANPINKDFEPFLTKEQLNSFEVTLIERFYDGQ